MGDLHKYLLGRTRGGVLPWDQEAEAAQESGLSLMRIEEAALESGLFPARYARNRRTLAAEDQLRLLRSAVAVVGCGGLGGYVIEELARLGIGRLTVIDPDVFEEHNLNRQILSLPEALGVPKVEIAAQRVAHVNPAVSVMPLRVSFSKDKGRICLEGAHVVVDALDDIRARLELAEACDSLGIPLVHGSIAGWYGQVTTQLPGDGSVQRLYGRCKARGGVEQEVGNPAFTPAVVAGIQASEVCKVLTGKGKTLSGRVMIVNLLDMEFETIEMKEDSRKKR